MTRHQHYQKARFIRKSRRGFTLLELLVVVAVIIVLVSLLIPVLSKAQRKAHSVDCMNRLKQLYLAFRYHVDDNEGLIPREGPLRNGEVVLNTWGQVQGRLIRGTRRRDGEDIWYNALPIAIGQKPASYYAPTHLRAEFYRNRFFHCPSARLPDRPADPHAYFSLAYNSQLILPPGRAPKLQTLEQMNDVSAIPLFLDGLLEGERKVVPAQETTHLGQPAVRANRASPRHEGRINIVLLDGHVVSFYGPEVVETDPKSALCGAMRVAGPIIWEPLLPWPTGRVIPLPGNQP